VKQGVIERPIDARMVSHGGNLGRGLAQVRVGRGMRRELVKGPLCADVAGFSLHAAVRVEARDRKRLEHLCRYAGRPAIAESRLSLLPDGRVAYSLKKCWKEERRAWRWSRRY
jgi:hypothetical protein